MSVAGIDFGSKSNVVALARRKGIDVVMNEESKRETPSLINFGDKCVSLSFFFYIDEIFSSFRLCVYIRSSRHLSSRAQEREREVESTRAFTESECESEGIHTRASDSLLFSERERSETREREREFG